MVADLYKQWAYQASQDGNYELAAKCWLAVDEFGQAAFRCGSCHLDRALNIGVEYQKIFIFCVFYISVKYIWRSFQDISRKTGWAISLKNLKSNLSFFSIN